MTTIAATSSRRYLQACVVVLAYFFLATVSIYFSKGDARVAHFWYPNAIAIAFLLRHSSPFKSPLIAALALANVGANWVSGNSVLLSLAFVLPNLFEITIAVWLIRRSHSMQEFDQSPQQMLRFLLQVWLPSSGLGAVVGASLLAVFQFAPFLQTWPLWFVGSSVGMLALLPFLLVLGRTGQRTVWDTVAMKKLLLYTLLIGGISYFALRFFPFPYIYLVIPLIFAALETDTRTVTFLIFVQSLVIGLMVHYGLFEPAAHHNESLIFLNYLPILVTFIPVFILIASMNSLRLQTAKRSLIEDDLQRSHRKLQTILDNAPALIGLWDKDLNNLFANRMYTTYFGHSPEEMLGKYVREIIGESLYEKNLSYFEAALRGESQMFERTIIDPLGRVRETLTSYVPSYRDGKIEGVFAFISDISDLRQAQQAERQAEARLQSVIDSATEFSIIATDTVGIVRLFSKGAEKMLGYASTDIVNQQSPAIFHLAEEVAARGKELSIELQREIAGFDVFVVKARKYLNETREWTYVHRSGRQIPVRLVVTAIFDTDQKITGYLGIAHDISDEKELQKLLISAKENAEQVSQAKSDFVANMSHEIRTPMNAVLGMSQLLAATYLNTEQRKYLEMIKTSGQSLLGILNDILDFSKIEANRLELLRSEFLLDDILGALANMMAVSVGERNIEVAIGVDIGVPKRLIGDPLRLQQVLTNLVGNALKFTAQGEVSIFVEKMPADSQQESQENAEVVHADAATVGQTVRLKFSIRDTGIGMNESQIAKLFQPFYQADASTTRQYGGTGLGLSITKRILDMMGASIEVHSQLGQGTEFQVQVPLSAMLDDQVDIPTHNPKQLRLLVVDDNATSNDYICRTIRSWDWLVESASSGPQALEFVRSRMNSQEMFDVILVDSQLPDMDGLTSIQYLSEMLPGGATSFVIMVSAHSRDQILHQPELACVDAILMKPITGSSMFDTVHEAIALNLDSAHLSPHRKSTMSHPRSMAGTRFLLVEDNPFNQIVAKGFLEQGGASVEVLDNGQLAVDHLRLHADQYDAVLMDVQMPIMDGITATKMIRSELGLRVPIIAMSAGVMYSERDRCIRSGMDDFVAKPVDIDQMFQVLAKYVTKRSDKDGKQSTVDGSLDHSVLFSVPDSIDETRETDYFNPTPFEKLARAAPESLSKIVASIKGVVEQAGQQWSLVRQAVQTQRWDDAARGLHSMRGSVGSLGAKPFAALTLQLETQIRAGDVTELERALAQAEADLNRSLNLAYIWLAQQEAQVQLLAAEPRVERVLNSAGFKQLRQLLQENNMQACDLFEEMRTALRARFGDGQMTQFERAMTGLDFKTALQLLDIIDPD